jgi:hypothetical protein
MNHDLLVNEQMVQLMTIRDNVGENPGAGTSCDEFQSFTRDGVHYRRTCPSSDANQMREKSIRNTEMINTPKIEQKKKYRRRRILYPAIQSHNHEINLSSGAV